MKQNVLLFVTEIEADFGVYIGFFRRARYSGVTINHIIHQFCQNGSRSSDLDSNIYSLQI